MILSYFIFLPLVRNLCFSCDLKLPADFSGIPCACLLNYLHKVNTTSKRSEQTNAKNMCVCVCVQSEAVLHPVACGWESCLHVCVWLERKQKRPYDSSGLNRSDTVQHGHRNKTASRDLVPATECLEVRCEGGCVAFQ